MHSQDTSELFFDNVKVPKNQLLGQAGQGFAYLMQELPRERTAIASTAVGAIRGAIDLATAYVKERHAFGQPISQFQNTRFVLAQAKLMSLRQRLSMSEMLLYIKKVNLMLRRLQH